MAAITSIYFPGKIKEKAQDEARRRGITLSQLVVRVLELELERKESVCESQSTYHRPH